MKVELVKNTLIDLQNAICKALEQVEDGKTFSTDAWSRSQGGGGVTRTMADGRVFAKVAVNFSHVSGKNLPKSAALHRQLPETHAFEALGVSVIAHPQNPYVPTTHANVRFFVTTGEGTEPVWWFGGGFDLTPYYGFVEDCVHWHQTAKQACDPFGEDLYALLKKNCDAYFYLPHRQEARGIGGLFFDDWHHPGFEQSFGFMKSVGDHFTKAYLPIVLRRKDIPFGTRETAFQRYRRGRYVEFNLIYDRGTLFGLQSGGRTESILASLPPEVSFYYDWQPQPGSPEERLYTEFLPARNWISLG